VRNLLKRLSRDPVKRRKAHSKYFERRLRRHDLHLYKSHLNWTMSETMRQLHAEWGEAPGIPADRCYFLYCVARLVAGKAIPGDTAECGVRFGKSSFFLLKGLADPSRQHHLFDSFEGLSEVGEQDRPTSGLKSWREGDISVGEGTVRRNLAGFENCRFHKGWIPDRFDEVANRTFAMVHIDVDLYQPTLDSLRFFYPRLAPGGLLVCDDYGFASCPGATSAFDEFFADKPESVLPIPSGQCLVWTA